jgi:hypothetical protein
MNLAILAASLAIVLSGSPIVEIPVGKSVLDVASTDGAYWYRDQNPLTGSWGAWQILRIEKLSGYQQRNIYEEHGKGMLSGRRYSVWTNSNGTGRVIDSWGWNVAWVSTPMTIGPHRIESVRATVSRLNATERRVVKRQIVAIVSP